MSGKNKKLYPRVCSQCNIGMSQGYCIGNGDLYYCSDDCLHLNFTAAQWNLMYSDDGDNYWTEWEKQDMIDDGIGYTITGEEVKIDE